jgi:hypothetical protein
MEWNEYLEFSEKTLSEGFYANEKEQKVLHSIMGIATEMEELLDNYDGTIEFDPVNVSEEVSDIFWYLAIIYREFDLHFPGLEKSSEITNPEKVVNSMNKDALRLLDIMKKKVFYNRDIDEMKFTPLVMNLVTNSANLMHHYGMNPHEYLQRNIDKLRARYGDKFSNDRANNRDLDTERTILEGKNKK